MIEREIQNELAGLTIERKTFAWAAEWYEKKYLKPPEFFGVEIRGLPWPGSGGFPGFAVTKDGRRFLVALAVDEPNATPITVILNWSAALKR